MSDPVKSRQIRSGQIRSELVMSSYGKVMSGQVMTENGLVTSGQDMTVMSVQFRSRSSRD